MSRYVVILPGRGNVIVSAGKYQELFLDVFSIPLLLKSDPQQQITYEDFDQIGKLDLEELDIKWQMAMLSVRINRFEKKAGRKMNEGSSWILKQGFLSKPVANAVVTSHIITGTFMPSFQQPDLDNTPVKSPRLTETHACIL
ncbi:hypothetical protein Tco_0378895 [Tanacetum coccineum]